MDYICTQWPLSPDKRPSAASRPPSCVFLICHCFSPREGHLLIDCLNPPRINTAGSLCDAYPSSPSPPHTCLQQAGGGPEKDRLHQITCAAHHIYSSECFMSVPEKQEGIKQSDLRIAWWRPHSHGCFGALYELWNESGLPNLKLWLHWHFARLSINLTAKASLSFW